VAGPGKGFRAEPFNPSVSGARPQEAVFHRWDIAEELRHFELSIRT